VEFTYILEEGQSEKSFAANVARIAGLPRNVVKRAQEVEMRITNEEEKLSSNRKTL
jgi:DNA mismatch repair protein MSH6